jgi:hypothetical protein
VFKREQDALDLADPDTSEGPDKYESAEVSRLKFEPGAQCFYDSKIIYKREGICGCGGNDPYCCPQGGE